MPTTISSSSLFHFAGTLQYLQNILTMDFRPRYYPEIIKFSNRMTFQNAIPVVCFCDLPLSQIKDHLAIYGDYGIGLTKEWGIKNELNPIIYLSSKSTVSSSLRDTVRNLNNQTLTLANASNDQLKLIELLRYTKNFKGVFLRRGRRIPSVQFYNEREWRYTPKRNPNIPFWLSMQNFNTPNVLAQSNNLLANHPLKFVPKDVKYIIIKDENDIAPMVQFLQNAKARYSFQDVTELTTRIITADQIRNDF